MRFISMVYLLLKRYKLDMDRWFMLVRPCSLKFFDTFQTASLTSDTVYIHTRLPLYLQKFDFTRIRPEIQQILQIQRLLRTKSDFVVLIRYNQLVENEWCAV